MRLAPQHAPGHVFGWRIADETTDRTAVLTATSQLGLDARLLISVHDTG